MKRLALFNLAILLVIIAALLVAKRDAHSEPQGERDQLVLKMLQAGSRGAGREVEAIASGFSRTTNIQPANQKNQTQARQFNDRGLAYVRVWDFQNATLEFDKAFAMNPADIEIANNLGFSLSKIGQHDEAKKRLLYTLALAPNRVTAWFNLGGVLAHQGDTVAAAGAFYNAILFSPKKQITVASIQTDTEYGPPELAEAYRNAVQMAGSDADPKTSAGISISIDERSQQVVSQKTNVSLSSRSGQSRTIVMNGYALNDGEVSVLKYLIYDDLIGYAQGKKTMRAFSHLKPDRVSADKLQNDYEQNEVRADGKYLGKTFVVYGSVESVNRGFGYNYYISLRNSYNMFLRPQANMSDGYKDYLVGLERGQHISLVCRGQGMSIGIATMDRCIPFSDWAKQEIDNFIYNIITLLSG